MLRNKITSFLLVLFTMLSLATSVSAISEENMKKLMQMSEQERKFLLMYFDEDELFVVSATRSLKSIDRIAENVEVVTAEDIELMNAHTLADVLRTVNGVQVYFTGASPISLANVGIQGSNFEQVAFFLDGIPLRLSDTNITVASDIPVQMIDRVEIIKGPASSAWGSSLGGVVNIITKSPGSKEKISGTLSASSGEQATMDFRAEAFGKKDKFGYYFTAGWLGTDGLRSEEEGWQKNLYAKLSYDLSADTSLLYTIGYDRKNRERSDTSALDWLDRDKSERFYTTLSLNSSLSSELDLNISLRAMRQRLDVFEKTVSTDEEIRIYHGDENLYGASAKLAWRHAAHNVVFGADYDDSEVNTDSYSSDKRSWAVFANDTIKIGKLAVTPGLRYDDSNTHDGFLSPSLGLTYEVADKTILRAVVSRGFNAPSISQTVSDWGLYFVHNPDLEVEKVWS
ncbi:MAG: TonB-dependent receptor, partial [Thermodesulfovibrionales bacterium]